MGKMDGVVLDEFIWPKPMEMDDRSLTHLPQPAFHTFDVEFTATALKYLKEN
jgi:hypothetical protein